MMRSTVLLTALAIAPRAAGAAGWLLLEPPPKAKPFGLAYLDFDTDAPFTRWEQVGSYDTAAACEAGRARLQEQVYQYELRKARLMPPRERREFAESEARFLANRDRG